jgi:hypothetical protein
MGDGLTRALLFATLSVRDPLSRAAALSCASLNAARGDARSTASYDVSCGGESKAAAGSCASIGFGGVDDPSWAGQRCSRCQDRGDQKQT